MCFPTEGGVEEVRGDQVVARECYMASLKGESALKETMIIDNLEVRDERTWVMAKPRELENIILKSTMHDRVTGVGSDLPEDFKRRL